MKNSGIAERMRRARESLNESQRSMAARIGLGAMTWQTYEQGRSLPGSDVLLRLCQEGINPTWILTGEGPMQFAIHAAQYTGFDRDLFRACWLSVEALLVDMKKTLSAEKRVALVFDVYDKEAKGRQVGQALDVARIIQMVRAAK